MKLTDQAEGRFYDKLDEYNSKCFTPYVKSTQKVEIKCSNEHHKPFMLSPTFVVNKGFWCPECEGTISMKPSEKYYYRVDQYGGTSLTPYVRANDEIRIQCNNDDHEPFTTTPNSVYNMGRWCPECSPDTQAVAKDKFNNFVVTNGGALKEEYIDARTPVEIICRCGLPFKTTLSHLLEGKWCSGCGGNNSELAGASFLEEVKKNNGRCLTEYKGAFVKVDIECPCGNVWPVRPHDIKGGSWCPACASSKGEKAVTKYLESNNIIFKRDTKFIPDSKLRCDFLLPDWNLVVEFDGEQHFRKVPFFDKTTTLEERRKNDTIKDN